MSDKLQLTAWRLAVALAVALLCQLVGARIAAAGQTQTFTPENGAEQAYSVSPEVTELKITAIGGAGKEASCDFQAAGGSGAKVTAVIDVREREKLYVQFGGGGLGGSASVCGVGGGEGGGASDVRELPYQLGTRLVVAGGGGGGGGGSSTAPGAGGNAEGPIGGDGSAGHAGGAGGEGGGEHSGGAGAAHNGSFGEGGEGQAGESGGGGGGGGYYGGGGGGAGGSGAAGGGAGSSYVTSAASSHEYASGAGEPQEVTIEAIKVPISAPEHAQIFYPEGSQQQYSVPANAKHLQLLAVGGAGEDGESVACSNPPATPVTGPGGGGGAGARVNAFLNVSGGEKLYVDFGLGGKGGPSGQCSGHAGSGGGDSDVQTESESEPDALLSQLVVAGGGGGGGGGNIFFGIEDGPGGGGGSASGLVGGDGGSGHSSCCGGGPGGGGGDTETGMGGSAGAEDAGSGVSAGGFGFAGNGGTPSTREYTTGGGGGGDGYYGGGGGECGGAGSEDPEECDKNSIHDGYAAGGGGAGSSYATAAVEQVSYESASGERRHVLIRPVAAPPTVTVQLAPMADYPVGQKGTATVTCDEEPLYAAGIESCGGQQGSSATVVLNTRFAGEYSLLAKAVSKDGAVTEKRVAYTVYNPLSAGVSSCNGLTGGSGKEVLVAEGARCTLIAGTHVSGQVRVEPGGSLIDSGATIGSNLLASEASAVQIGGSHANVIGGSVELERLAGTVGGARSFICNATIEANLKIGQAANRVGAISVGAEECSTGDSIHGSLTLARDASAISTSNTSAGAILIERDTAPVTFLAATASKTFTVRSNSAPVNVSHATVAGNLSVLTNTAEVLLEHDEAGGNLLVEHNSGGVEMLDNATKHNAQCKNNTPPATGSGTSAHEHNLGCPV